jgi:HK97 family phage major capsid protein
MKRPVGKRSARSERHLDRDEFIVRYREHLDPDVLSFQADDVLAQPVAKAEKAAVFVPFSIEVGADYQGLQAELAKLYVDAKDQLEAEAFINGGGTATNQPQGLHVGGTATVSTAAGTAVLGGIYATQNALGSRYQGRASWISSNTIANLSYRLVGGGNTTEPQPWNETRDVLLGKPWTEASTMTTSGTATGGTILSYGDYASAYTIVDRIGLQAELIPHIFGTASHRPTGQRGLYGYFRVGAVVTNANAVKSLKIA